MNIVVQGMWHLGCVTAACLAHAGHIVVGLDTDNSVIGNLQQGRPPLYEPGLEDMIRGGLASERLHFSTNAATALAQADLLWVAFDTPVNDQDEADVAFVRSQLESIAHALVSGTLVLISSQVPVGFTQSLESAWVARGLHFAYSPENLRLGKALDVFQNPERVVIGIRHAEDQRKLAALFPEGARLEWMSIESAEMTKHALNAFLATSVTFINELARLCEVVGADAKEVERGLKSEKRIGPQAYLSPGNAIAGGTLARDVCFLRECGRHHELDTSLLDGILKSNQVHKDWVLSHVHRLLRHRNASEAVVAILGLTYKPGTDTLRRSLSIELCEKLRASGVQLKVHDPMIRALPSEYSFMGRPCGSVAEALGEADVAVIATPWPEYRQLEPGTVLQQMRRPQIIDANHFLAAQLGNDPRITYVATGRPASVAA